MFAAVGSKQAILKRLRDIALAGDDEPVPVAQRPWYREALAEPDPRRALRLYARNATAIHRRSAVCTKYSRSAAARPLLRMVTMGQAAGAKRVP